MNTPNQGSPEARGLGSMKQMGTKIGKALNGIGSHKPIRQTRNINWPGMGKSSLSVIPSARYRRYFGIRSPGSF